MVYINHCIFHNNIHGTDSKTNICKMLFKDLLSYQIPEKENKNYKTHLYYELPLSYFAYG